MTFLQDILSLLFICVYTVIAFRFLAEKKINYIHRYIFVSLAHLAATTVILLLFHSLFTRYLPLLNWTFSMLFILIILFVVLIYLIFRRFIKREIVIRHQKSGTYATSLSPYYAISKSFNILFQQTLILISIFLLKDIGFDIAKIAIGFAAAFGIAHIVLVDHKKPYTSFVIVTSFFAGAIFPILILNYQYGFVYTYILHWSFIALMGILPHFLTKDNLK